MSEGRMMIGVYEPKPARGFPEGRVKWIMRPSDYVRAAVRTADGLRIFAVRDAGDAWEPIPGCEIGANRRTWQDHQFAYVKPFPIWTDTKGGDWIAPNFIPKNGTEVLVLWEVATVPIVRLAWWDGETESWWSYENSVSQEELNLGEPVGWRHFKSNEPEEARMERAAGKAIAEGRARRGA